MVARDSILARLLSLADDDDYYGSISDGASYSFGILIEVYYMI